MGGRLDIGTNTILAFLSTPVVVELGGGILALGDGFFGRLGRRGIDSLDVLLGDEALEPLVFHLELTDACLEELDLVGHVLGGLLESLLTLLLLDTETSTGGGVAPTLVLFGGVARVVLKINGRRDGSQGSLSLLTSHGRSRERGWSLRWHLRLVLLRESCQAIGRGGWKALARQALGARLGEGEVGELKVGF